MRRRRAQTGFTLIELLIVVAIIGIIAAMLIPNFLDALQKAKQKRTVADMRITGTALFAWLSDQVGAAAAGGQATEIDISADYTPITFDALRTLLVPTYIEHVPLNDGWKTPYQYFLNTTNLGQANIMAIGSGGRDMNAVSGKYEAVGFDPTDYDQDILWADGFFVRWPQK
jgi:general secretion pathway protein G